MKLTLIEAWRNPQFGIRRSGWTVSCSPGTIVDRSWGREMASRANGETEREISVGSVFGRGIDVIKSNPVATLGTSLVLMALPQLLFQQVTSRAVMYADLRNGIYAAVAAYFLVIGLLWLVASGALVQATVAHDQGRKADIGEMLRVGVLRCLPLLAVYLLFVIGVWIGSILLLVPGIMLAVMWSVTLPAIVAERTGIFGAFSRSRALTKGARWKIFGILLLMFVIYILVTILIGVISVAGYGSFGAIMGGAEMPVSTPSIFLQLLQALVTAVMITWLTTMGASLFVELRHWKDGPDTDRLTDIFA
ncbi:glycerophosphoryl diester phosphodiesterase membrane domain-containing protein [Sphingomonas sp. GB1N7]|uniref:glycerophosphoryl diester phosphodiesterase membrane domain-containing protein n=1 Tax=Parasphingomonas caseinilytica TaxID=3096158 RepID=UPI002FC9C837